VVEIQVVNLVFEDRDRALLAGDEVEIRRDVVILAAAGKRRAVVLAGAGAIDIEPRADHVNRFGKADLNRCVARSVESVSTRISAQDQRSEFDDWSGLPWRRRAGYEVAAVSVGV